MMKRVFLLVVLTLGLGLVENCDAQTSEILIDVAQLELIKDVTVAARDSGIVNKVSITEGEEVLAKQNLVELDRDLNEAEVQAASKELEIARQESENEVDLEYAKKSAQVNGKVLERSRNARKAYSRAVSRTEIERLELELERAELSGKQAEHTKAVNALKLELRETQADAARLKLESRNVNSPINGVVSELFVQEGEWVNAGSPIARVINVDMLRVSALVDNKHAFSIKKGQQAEFEFALGEETKTARGIVIFVSPESDPVNEKFMVRVDIDNSKQTFRAGFRGTLKIFGE